MSRRSPSEILRHAMERRGLNQKEFARLIKVDPGTVTKWLKGTQLPHPDRIATVAAAAGIDEAEFSLAINAARHAENRRLKADIARGEATINEILSYIQTVVEDNRAINAKILETLEARAEDVRSQTELLTRIVQHLEERGR